MKFLAMFFLSLIGFTSPLCSMNIQTIGQEVTERDLCHKVLDCFNFVDGDFSIEGAVEDLCKARGLLVEKGYNAPLLSVIFEKTFEGIESQGISLDGGFVEDLYELVLSKETDGIRNASFYSQSQYRPKIYPNKLKNWFWATRKLSKIQFLNLFGYNPSEKKRQKRGPSSRWGGYRVL
ncbi:hypothetical protein [Candidatus Neptunochlamydia vexilliferae]|uniref:hypothetical protein n=1 Tax=Candidatus Neptunichlamydia vexilliferae TaxID=1651774 RepID=UPI0018913E08|nr:hypothetical protein [Candidatus Neptunochlamydia vexilliferae]